MEYLIRQSHDPDFPEVDAKIYEIPAWKLVQARHDGPGRARSSKRKRRKPVDRAKIKARRQQARKTRNT